MGDSKKAHVLVAGISIQIEISKHFLSKKSILLLSLPLESEKEINTPLHIYTL